MKITNAISILEKERNFLGLGLLELLQDVQKNGRMVYSNQVVEATSVFMAEGVKLFALAEDEEIC
jgi:hypothetical protein